MPVTTTKKSDASTTTLRASGTGRPDHVEDPVRQYLDAIGKTPLLTAAEEVDLSRRIEAGVFAEGLLRRADSGEAKLNADRRADLALVADDGREARDHMIRANLRLVVSVARRYAGDVPLLDVVQEGNLGLIRAVEKFDYAKGFKFSTYATWWIKQAIQRGLPEQIRTIRLPAHVVEQVAAMGRAERKLTARLDREPTIEEVAAEMQLTPEKVTTLRDASRHTVSLDAPLGDAEDGSSLTDLIERPDTERVGDTTEQRAFADDVRRVVEERLPPREALIVVRRFGLDGREPRGLAQIGEELGLTRERIRQLEKQALAALRRPSQDLLESWVA